MDRSNAMMNNPTQRKAARVLDFGRDASRVCTGAVKGAASWCEAAVVRFLDQSRQFLQLPAA